MKKIKPILISVVFITLTGLLVWLGPEISQTSRVPAPPGPGGAGTLKVDAKDAPPVFKAISNKMDEVKATRLKPGDVKNVQLNGQKKDGTQRHLELVKEIKDFCEENCHKLNGDFAKIQRALNQFAAMKRSDTRLGFRKVALELKFLNKQGDKCSGTLFVQTDETGQEVKF